MLDGELLHRLCHAYGIQEGFHDLSGHFHQASAETRNMLLENFGVPIGDEKRAWQHLLGREEDQRRPLPHTVVIRYAHEGMTLWPARADDHTIPWRLIMEDGNFLEGEARSDNGIEIPSNTPLGYHRLELWPDSGAMQESFLIIAPQSARHVDSSRKRWGITTPLYGLKSSRNWGIGDFEDLANLATAAGEQGAAFIGINPVHALFPKAPGMYSPYSPSSREFLNVMHIAVDRIAEFWEDESGQKFMKSRSTMAALKKARDTDHVDYPAVYALKLKAFEKAFSIFESHPDRHPRKVAYRRYLKKKGKALWHHCLYEVLAEHLGGEDTPLYDWQAWDKAYHRPSGRACKSFEAENRSRIHFYAYLQWIAAEQIDHAQQAALSAGMDIGLYLDLAVGMVPGGAEVWTNQKATATRASLGAPGDDANPDGQKWHLSPLDPNALKETGYALFRKTLRNMMASAGMIRIDHILGANRSFWSPLGSDTPGGYVTYPLDDLLGIIALESNRSNCLVVGEDLGMVPEGFRDTLGRNGLMGCSLFLFERYEDGSFKQPYDYPPNRLASLSNHDFPTIAGFLDGADIRWREELGIGATDEQLADARARRDTDRFRIKAMLRDAGMLAQDTDDEKDVIIGLHRFLASTGASLIAVQIEDLLGQVEQMNVPGTTSEQPNWRRKLSHPIETIFSDKAVSDILTAVTGIRPSQADDCGSENNDHQNR
ncbi:4-alpha-glucanotransferase [Kordiimonas lipolytica]|uniref:4-alpha-glucanotransferase n=1 Tax=Kordiimonas lipolytica TaxID=1662421 RepID=A0ABV8U9B3_9PROT|nr:4-alpha-glucanotransferase [Kordiimonas lipolytica]